MTSAPSAPRIVARTRPPTAAPPAPQAVPQYPGATTGPVPTAAPPARRAILQCRDLAPIGLDELNDTAGLLTRVDRKYLVPLNIAQEMIDALAPTARVLEIDGRRVFSYSSVYLDTPGLDSFLLTAHKRRRRFKVRTRSYLDSSLAFLEVKTRGPRGATVKHRMACDIPCEESLAWGLSAPGRDFVASCLAGAVSADEERARELAGSLAPVMSTAYERTTLHLPGSGARLTLDTRMRWTSLTRSSAAAGPATRPGTSRWMANVVIVETKNPLTPSPADHWLWSAGLRPAALSKYATGMALLHPGLPANKWHRLLTRELAPPAPDPPPAAEPMTPTPGPPPA